MNKNDDRMWSAYIDAELSITELEKFESELSNDQLEQLKREKDFEKQMSSVLKKGVKCPDDLWRSICEQIEEEENIPSRRKWVVMVTSLAAAAAVVLAFFRPTEAMSLQPLSIAQLETSRLVENDLVKVNAFLAKKNIPFKLLEFNKKVHHTKSLIGAGVEEISGEKVTTLFFECCGEPVKVYMLPKNSKAEQSVSEESSLWGSGMTMTMLNDYRLAMVSRHTAPEILEFIKPI